MAEILKNPSSLCFTTVVRGIAYLDYIPLFIFFALRAFPQSHICIHICGLLPTKVRKNIELLLPQNDSWSVLENYKVSYPKNKNTLKSLRWVLFSEFLNSFDYLYVGDIDILLSKGSNLLNDHILHSEFLGLPYSNIIRGSQKRLSGLHFVDTKAYYKLLKPIIFKYDKLLKSGNLSGIRNETVLYLMLKEAKLLPPVWGGGFDVDYISRGPLKIAFRPHHGVHLRVVDMKHEAIRKSILNSNIYREVYIPDFQEAFQENPGLMNVVERSHPVVKLQILQILRGV